MPYSRLHEIERAADRVLFLMRRVDPIAEAPLDWALRDLNRLVKHRESDGLCRVLHMGWDLLKAEKTSHAHMRRLVGALHHALNGREIQTGKESA